jgi:hypothetical protein
MVHTELGDQLRRAREAKSLSLDEAERATGIRRRFLQAMEEGRFDLLPGEIQLRGFLRNYAKHVGLNGEELLAIYERRTRPAPAIPAAPVRPAVRSAGPAFTPTTPGPSVQPAAPNIPTQPSAAAQPTPTPQPVIKPQIRPSAASTAPSGLAARLPAWVTLEMVLIAIAVLMVVCVIVLVVLLVTAPGNGAPSAAPRPAATRTRLAAPPQPAATMEPTVGAALPNITSSVKLTTTADFVQVTLAATEHVWVRVMTDGKTAFEGMFAPGQSLKWEAKEMIVVETGNGAGLNTSVNGKAIGAFGARGQLAARAWTPVGETAVPPKPTAAITPNP